MGGIEQIAFFCENRVGPWRQRHLKIPLIVGVYLADEVGEDGLIIGGTGACAGGADDLTVGGQGKDANGGFYAGSGAGGVSAGSAAAVNSGMSATIGGRHMISGQAIDRPADADI